MKTVFTSIVLLFSSLLSMAYAAPVLSSHPSASATLYLDFDGHYVSSSMWNYGTAFTCDPAAMTDVQITEVFNRVAEDFRPFNINVTTDINTFLAAPISMRVRIVITPTSSWYAGVAGIAYVGSFTWGDDTPAFAFSDRLYNDPKRVAEAVSHESGHTVGLSHQALYNSTCGLLSSYNSGTGFGETGWAPIMGNGVSRNVTQWNYGPTPNGCTSVQDNLKIITTNNGFGYRTDDYTSAHVIGISSNYYSRTGIVSTTSDQDIFRFDLGQNGQFTAVVRPFAVGANNSGANLDVKLTLQNANGTTIAVYDYKDSLHARLDTLLNAGTYFLVIDGSGSVNSTNDYGSLGSYALEGYYSGTTTTSSTVTSPTTDTTTTTTAPTSPTTTTKGKGGGGTTTSGGGGKKKETNASITNITSTDESGNKIFRIIKQVQQPIVVIAAEQYDYQIFDNNGRIIMTGKAGAGSKAFDLRSQPAGIYNIRLLNPKEQKTDRFLNK